MNAEKLIEKLNGLGFTPEAFDEQLYSSGSYGNDSKNNDEIISHVGEWTRIEDSEKLVLHFILHDIYLGAHETSGSYGYQNWTGWYEVFPTTKTIYTTKEEDDSSYNSSY